MKIPLSKLFKKVTAKKHRVAHGLYNPVHDWKIVLIFFVFIAIILAGLSGYLFLKINRGEIFITQKHDTQTVSVLNVKLLEKTVGEFEEKKAHLLELETEKVIASDPSI